MKASSADPSRNDQIEIKVTEYQMAPKDMRKSQELRERLLKLQKEKEELYRQREES